jgi:hypothetical protein
MNDNYCKGIIQCNEYYGISSYGYVTDTVTERNCFNKEKTYTPIRMPLNVGNINVRPDKTGCYKYILKYMTYIELRTTMYTLLSIIVPSFSVGHTHGSSGSNTGYINPPYEAVHAAINLIEKDLYGKDSDDVKNNLDVVDKYNKLNHDHQELKKKYSMIVQCIDFDATK